MSPQRDAPPLGTIRVVEQSDEEEQLRALRPGLVRWALALGADPDEIDDIVQETLLAAHRHFGGFDPDRGSLFAWTAEILVRRLRNRNRTLLRYARMLVTFGRSAPRVERPAAEVVEARLTLGRLVEALTDRQREVVALYEIAELSAEETGRILELTAAGVRSIARDARRRLAEASRSTASREGPR